MGTIHGIDRQTSLLWQVVTLEVTILDAIPQALCQRLLSERCPWADSTEIWTIRRWRRSRRKRS
eukprot:5802654-Amphidinium_carterae.1